MRRGGSDVTHLRLLRKLRARMPRIAVRTTFIVGFPGETTESFERLCRFVEAAEFDHVGVFTYSEEKGTTAAGLSDDVPAELKEHRRARLMEIQEGMTLRRHAKFVGQTIEVLVDGAHEESDLLICGRTAGQAPEIDGKVILTDAPHAVHPGEFVRVLVEEAHPHDLIGAVLEKAPAGRDA